MKSNEQEKHNKSIFDKKTPYILLNIKKE